MGCDTDAFRPTSTGPAALFLDTSALFAYFHPGVAEHDEARAFVQRVGANEIPYRPLYTSTYVLDELATLLEVTGSREFATAALETTLDSDSVEVLPESPEQFARARSAFEEEDVRLSFTDYLTAVQMRAENVSHVFAYDGDFARLGFEQLPR